MAWRPDSARSLRDAAFAINEVVTDGLPERGSRIQPAHGTIGQQIADGGSHVTDLTKLA